MSFEDLKRKLEQLQAELPGSGDLPAAEGDYPFRWGSALLYVSLIDQEPPLVSVYAGLLSGVGKTDKLCVALNDINAQIKWGRVFWVRNRVIAAADLLAQHLDQAELENAFKAVGKLADRYDHELQQQFGGRLAFRDDSA
jgi:hypothetical protein